MGQLVENRYFQIRTEKTGIQVTIPILPEFAEVLAASRTGDLAFIVSQGGRPIKKESFGNWFRRACKAAGVPGPAHGLRKAGATRAANNGATVAQLKAIFGWDDKQPSHYTRTADRAGPAREAMGKLTRG